MEEGVGASLRIHVRLLGMEITKSLVPKRGFQDFCKHSEDSSSPVVASFPASID